MLYAQKVSLGCLGAKQKSPWQSFKGPMKEARGHKWPFSFYFSIMNPLQSVFADSRGHAAKHLRIRAVFRLARDSFALCIQIFADAPELCPLSPAAPVSSSAPTRLSKKQSRQNRPLAVYNPQALDIQNGESLRV